MLHEPLLKRRGALSDLLAPVLKKSSAVNLSQTVSASAQDMIRAITELELPRGGAPFHFREVYSAFRAHPRHFLILGGKHPSVMSLAISCLKLSNFRQNYLVCQLNLESSKKNTAHVAGSMPGCRPAGKFF
jgi:hypothetical protein